MACSGQCKPSSPESDDMTNQAREYVPCNLCGGDRTKLWARAGEAQLVQCLGCGLVYTNPRLPADTLRSSYEGEYTAEHQDAELARQRRAMYLLEREAILRRAEGGRLLDVGCGPGDFLALLADRFEVYGVDVSHVYVQHAREKLGLENVHLGELTEAAFPDAFFDVAQMRGVIQHLPDPLGQVREAFRVTKPGGLLIVSATPNIESWCARIFRERHRLIAPDHMVYDFSPRTLRRLLEKAGYIVQQFAYPYLLTPYFRWRQAFEFIRLSALIGLERIIPPLRFNLRSPPFWGNMMTCYARKPRAGTGGKPSARDRT